MYGIQSFAILSSCSLVYSYVVLLRRSKKKKSIAGISYDFVFLSWLSYFLSIATSCLYLKSSRICEEYQLRNPIYPNIPISHFVLLGDSIGFIVVSGMLLQLYFVYPLTRYSYQGLSTFIKVTGIFVLIFTFWFGKCCLLRQNTLIYLDFVDFVWAVSRVSNILKLLPQVFVNLLARHVVGISDKFLAFQWLSILSLMVCRRLIKKQLFYYEYPVNMNGWVFLTIYTLLLMFLSIQKKVLYKERLQFSKVEEMV